jgi:type I restriction enzyme S subunit
LEYFIRTARSDLSTFAPATAQKNINIDILNEVLVPLPPLPEQLRIVDKIRQVISGVSACERRLNHVRFVLTRFRKAILSAACFGKLTEDWRSQHEMTDRTAASVVAIRERRLAAATTPAGKQRISEKFAQVEVGDADLLPNGWKFVRLAKLADSLDYGTSTKSQPTGSIPVLRMGNIQYGEIDWTDLVFTSDKEETRTYELQPNTVLFNRTNSPELVGKTAIYRGERRAIFAGYLIRVCAGPELDPEYLNLCLNTVYAREFCYQVKTDGVSQSNINAQKLGAFEVPYCSMDEQREIVRRIKELFAVADKIEARYTKATQYIGKLKQSVLTKAFRGELVTTEAELAQSEGREFESAEQLLDRTKNARATPVKHRGVAQHAPITRRSGTRALT